MGFYININDILHIQLEQKVLNITNERISATKAHVCTHLSFYQLN